MLNILVNELSLEQNKRGTITGEVYFQVGNTYFPESHWSDLIVVILTWWNKSINLIITSSVGVSAEFNFMDGPYFVKGIKKDEEVVTLSFYKRNLTNDELLYTVNTEILELKSRIVEASARVLNTVQSRQWHSDEISKLSEGNL